jgi:hypothetical protein
MPALGQTTIARNSIRSSASWELVLRESHHRMKNTLMLLGASVRRDFRRAGSTDVSVAVDRFERRVVAFGRLYQFLSDDAGRKTISVAAFFESLCGALSEAILEPAGIRCEADRKRGSPGVAMSSTCLDTDRVGHKRGKTCLSQPQWRNDPDRDWISRRLLVRHGGGRRRWRERPVARDRRSHPGRSCAKHWGRILGEAGCGGTRVTIVMPSVDWSPVA